MSSFYLAATPGVLIPKRYRDTTPPVHAAAVDPIPAGEVTEIEHDTAVSDTDYRPFLNTEPMVYEFGDR